MAHGPRWTKPTPPALLPLPEQNNRRLRKHTFPRTTIVVGNNTIAICWNLGGTTCPSSLPASDLQVEGDKNTTVTDAVLGCTGKHDENDNV